MIETTYALIGKNDFFATAHFFDGKEPNLYWITISLPWIPKQRGICNAWEVLNLSERVLAQFGWKIPPHRCDCGCEDGYRSLAYNTKEPGIQLRLGEFEHDARTKDEQETAIMAYMRRISKTIGKGDGSEDISKKVKEY